MKGLNLGKLRAAISKNRVALGALGALAVGALAWRARSSGQSEPAVSAGGRASSTPAFYSTGGQTSGASGYDSTASDVYNAIQPQLEELGRMLEEARNPAPIPVPVPEAEPPSYGTSRRNAIAEWYRDILGREASLKEVNFHDRSKLTDDQIRLAILRSPEAKQPKAGQ